MKKAIHYAMFFSDYSLGKELGHDLSFIDPIQDLQKRYLAVKHYFNRLGHFQQQSFEGGQRMQSIEALERLNTNLQNWGGQKRLAEIGDNGKTYKRPSELQHLECINRVSQFKKNKNRSGELCNCERRNTVASLAIPRAAAQSAQIFRGQILPITSSVLDYEEVAIPEDSVIYCDIPYEDTNVYNKAEGFDYERFYQWCERQTQPVFISSYQMPEDRFDCIEEFTHRSTLSATANNLVTERIYVPKHQAERGNSIVQLTLF